MNLLAVIAPVFWGVVVFSVLVFVHEGGHFLAARACGVRVTEFFLGLPCRFNLSHASKRIGTRFGVTPILLGGYAAVCGMDPTEVPCAPRVLGAIHRAGRISVEELEAQLDLAHEEVMDAVVLLLSWGSIAPVYDASKGEGPRSAYYASAYAAVPRDRAGHTVFDGRVFDRAHATAEGEAWEPPVGDEAFFAAERERTYIGKGFWKRALILLAGILVNLITGMLLVVIVYSAIGVEAPRDTNVLGSVIAESPAQQAGLQAGDRITTIDGTDVSTWSDILKVVQGKKAGDTLEVAYTRSGTARTAQVKTGSDGKLGIGVSYEHVHLAPWDSVRVGWTNLTATAQGVVQLLIPQKTVETLNNSTSVIGISVMSAQAAAAGPATLLNFIALISFSLAFMNLLPIPPLDGGKLLIEIIQKLTRRQVPMRIQTGISYAVMALLMVLFVYLARADILRFF